MAVIATNEKDKFNPLVVHPYSDYIKGFRRRLAKERVYRSELRAEAWATAKRAAHILAEEFHVHKVYLFGSILREDDYFNEKSDIDLAVQGLPEKIYFQAARKLDELFSNRFEFDLVTMESCPESLRRRVLREGVILYGAH